MLAIIVATVLSMALGFLWYGPLFGKPWMKLSGLTKEKIEKNKKNSNMALTYSMSTLGTLVMATVQTRLINMLNIESLYSALSLGFWLWLGFIATTMALEVIFGGKPWKLYLINVFYQLATVLIISILVIKL